MFIYIEIIDSFTMNKIMQMCYSIGNTNAFITTYFNTLLFIKVNTVENYNHSLDANRTLRIASIEIQLNLRNL
jgi:hypothetical protein